MRKFDAAIHVCDAGVHASAWQFLGRIDGMFIYHCSNCGMNVILLRGPNPSGNCWILNRNVEIAHPEL